jgi:hypothetical protein
MPDRAFDFKKFVWYVMSRKYFDYKSLFWRILSWSLTFKCSDCGEWFEGVHFFDCRYHPKRPIFPSESFNEGFYPCC